MTWSGFIFKPRRETVTVPVGNFKLGSGHPILVSTMLGTRTQDVVDSVKQCVTLDAHQAEIIRWTVMKDLHAKCTPEIIREARGEGVKAAFELDFHNNPMSLTTNHMRELSAADIWRANPGNADDFIGFVRNTIEAERATGKPIAIRAGVNEGSLDRELMKNAMLLFNTKVAFNTKTFAETVQPYYSLLEQEPFFKQYMGSSLLSHEKIQEMLFLLSNVSDVPLSRIPMLLWSIETALMSVSQAMKQGMREDRIMLSIKMGDPKELYYANTIAARLLPVPIPFHIGGTEQGSEIEGKVSATTCFIPLLAEGIGDTMRASITPVASDVRDEHEKRTDEVELVKSTLQSLGLRYFGSVIKTCPKCGRERDDYEKMAEEIKKCIKRNEAVWKKKGISGFEGKRYSVLGCWVNSDGEAAASFVGVANAGDREKGYAVYVERYPGVEGLFELLKEKFGDRMRIKLDDERLAAYNKAKINFDSMPLEDFVSTVEWIVNFSIGAVCSQDGTNEGH